MSLRAKKKESHSKKLSAFHDLAGGQPQLHTSMEYGI